MMETRDCKQFPAGADPDMSTLRSPVLRALYDFWIDLRQGDGLPSRSDFAPTNLPARLLPHIAIADVIRNDERLDFGWRLIGTHTTANTGRDMTGRRFSDIYAGENHDDLVANYIWVVRNELPLRWYGNSQFVEREWMQLEVVGMPLANDGRTVDKLFLGAVYSSFPE